MLNSNFNIAPFNESNAVTKDGIDLNIVHYYLSDKDKIVEQLGLSLDMFTKLFGKLDNKKLNVVVNADPNYNAYYGYSQISGAFLNSDMIADGACDMAKLWWADQINISSYRDEWLYAGICSYASLLYIQLIRKDYESYNRNLNLYAKEIKTQLSSLTTKGRKPGIISVGYRNGRDFDRIVELKSVWVFQMIRNMMLDLNTMNEDLFVTTLRDFFKTYKGKLVTTQDFRDCLEKNTKFDFSWFFEEWLNTNDIPTYKYAYKTEKVDGKFVTKFRVKQENVPTDFKMLIPIALVDDNKKSTATRAYITGDKVIEFALAPTATEPDKVVFNYLNSVLCELDEVGWNSLKPTN